MKKLILASGSPHRQALLQRLQLPFTVEVPDLDESQLAGELPADMALRLASAKAALVADRVADRVADAVVIGSDQVAQRGTTILGKPGDAASACKQLRNSSGRQVDFYTAICVIDGASRQQYVEPFHVQFRELSEREIQRYVELEQPLDCAGSFKCEGLGSALLQRLWGDDPTALQGLPLIRLSHMLRQRGLDPLVG